MGTVASAPATAEPDKAAVPAVEMLGVLQDSTGSPAAVDGDVLLIVNTMAGKSFKVVFQRGIQGATVWGLKSTLAGAQGCPTAGEQQIFVPDLEDQLSNDLQLESVGLVSGACLFLIEDLGEWKDCNISTQPGRLCSCTLFVAGPEDAGKCACGHAQAHHRFQKGPPKERKPFARPHWYSEHNCEPELKDLGRK
jgi:hypothetical protein